MKVNAFLIWLGMAMLGLWAVSVAWDVLPACWREVRAVAALVRGWRPPVVGACRCCGEVRVLDGRSCRCGACREVRP